MGDGGGGHCLVQMEWCPAGWSVCLPLLIFPCTIKSRSSLLAPAHPGGPGKKGRKTYAWCRDWGTSTLRLLLSVYWEIPNWSNVAANKPSVSDNMSTDSLHFCSSSHFHAMFTISSHRSFPPPQTFKNCWSSVTDTKQGMQWTKVWDLKHY